MREKAIIRSAIKILQKLNWIKGTWYAKNNGILTYTNCLDADSCCLDGALIIAKKSGHCSTADLKFARTILLDKVRKKYGSEIEYKIKYKITVFNDSIAKSKEEVIQLLQETLND